MIKISRLADYAVVLLASFKGRGGELASAATLSERTRIPEPTVSKILKLLAKADVLASVRGPAGGYKLARPLHELNVSDIIIAIDGPISLTACVEKGDDACGMACHCPVKGLWDEVNLAIRGALEDVSLADMLSRSENAASQRFMSKEEHREHI